MASLTTFPKVEFLFRALQAPLCCCFELLRSVTIPVESACSTHGSAGGNRITEYLELEGTQEDHQLQLLILQRTPRESHGERCQSWSSPLSSQQSWLQEVTQRRGAASASSATARSPVATSTGSWGRGEHGAHPMA